LAGTAKKNLLAWAKKPQIAGRRLFFGDGDSGKVTQLGEEVGHVGPGQPGSPQPVFYTTLTPPAVCSGYNSRIAGPPFHIPHCT
ncbi:hypothetical protein Q2379_26475, partial [Escherichia coli]|nr:hypothetical protein [Escherichia coli]